MQEFKENYLNQNERMNPQLENMLKSNSTDLADNPAFPKTDANGNPINFLELIAYKRFLEVVERVKRYTNLTDVTGQAGMSRLTPMLMQGVNFIEQVEQPHKLALENLAVDLVVEEMEIPDDVFQFQCKIVNRGEINQDGFQKETKEPSEEEINQTLSNEAEAENMTPSEFFEMEKHKRRFINMLIQGSSKKGHYMFELVRNKLNEYNPNLAKSYGEVMSINDLIYWLLDDETINQMASQPSAMAGKEEIEQSEDGTIIKTEAICFPVSLHEIIKGVMETFGTQGLPDDPQQANMVIDAVDSLSNETMDLRLGAIIWEKFINAYPRMVFDEGNRYLQHYLFSRFCGLETTEFFRVARMIMANDSKGAKYMERMTDEIISDLNVDEFEKNKDDNEDDINIDDLFNYKKGGQTKNKKGDIGKSGTQYGYTLKEWDKIAEKNGLLVSPTQWWKSQEGKKYKDFVGRNKIIGQHSGDKAQEMNKYGYMIANGMDLGSDKIPASAKKYVQENNLNKFGEGGGISKFDPTSLLGTFLYSQTTHGHITDIRIISEENIKVEYTTNSNTLSIERSFTKQELYDMTKGKKIRGYEMPKSMAKGGKAGDDEHTHVDLFEDYENIPANVQEIIDEYDLEEDSDYDTLLELQNRLETIGYTFEYGLDAVPYGLRPSSVKLNELQGYENEQYAGGGKAEKKYYWIKMNKSKIDEYIDYASRMVGMFEGEIYTQAPNKVAFDTEDDMFHFTSMLENDDIEYEELYDGKPTPNIWDRIIGNKYAEGGEAFFDATKLDLDNSISSRVYYTGVDSQINKILQNDYRPVYDFDKNGIEWIYKNTLYEVKDEDLILELKEALAQRNRGVVDIMRINNELPRIETKYGKDVNFAKKMYQEAKDFYQNKLRNEKSNKANDVLIDYLILRLKENKKGFAEGGEAEFDIYDYDKKMALINLGQVYEYAIKLDKIIKEDTDLEEWVKMKLTRIEQNISDVKHSLEGWEKYEDGGEIPKKQLLHIAKYSKDLIEMISNGSKLMSWQEDKLAISSASIDDIYHHLDYEMGNRAEDLDVDNEYRRGGRPMKREKVIKVRARGGYSLDDFFPLLEVYNEKVSYQKIGKLKLNQIVGKNGIADTFEFKTEGDRDYWFEILNKEQETYFTVKNKKKYVKYVLDNHGNYSEESEDNDLKTLSEKLDYFADDLDYDLRLNTTREDFIYYLDLDVDDEYGRGGFVSKGELVWRKLSSSDKINFLNENFTPQITARTQQTLTGKAYNFLPKNVKIVLESKYANVEDYAGGGKAGKKSFGEVYDEVVKYIMSDQNISYDEAVQIIDEENSEVFIKNMVESEEVYDAEFIAEQILSTDEGKYAGGGNPNWKSLGYTFKTEKEAHDFVENMPKEEFDKLGDLTLVFNGKEFILAEITKKKYTKSGKKNTIKDWYIKNYPTDDLGEELNDATFNDLMTALNDGVNVYSVIGVDDSVVRERLFEHLAEINGVEYNNIYDKWLESDDEYAEDGEVQEWMEKALQSLIQETGNNNLQIFYVRKNDFTCQDDDGEEYRVFENEDLAYDYAVEEVESDLEYQPENFNREFLMEYVEIGDLFVNSFENINYDYTKDIQSEKSEKYENRLIEELVANGLISEEEAQTRSSKELDEEYTQDYIDLLTSEQIGDDNGITHFIDNFGENQFFALVYENNLIDVEYASKKAVEIDGIAHFLAGYDGETIYLDNNNVAYRTN